MTATREHRNMGALEDAGASVGTTITVMEHLLSVLSHDLPDDVNVGELHLALGDVREAHNKLEEALGV